MRAYIVKYWATQGIFPLEGEVTESGRFMARWPNGMFQSFSPSEFALGTNEAVEKAKALRERKLQSLQREAERLLKLEIEVKV